MSVHVTVSSNPITISRSKVLLTDPDFAKKNEWNRRRKLRLQQVRQQSRDLASNLRKKCESEKKLNQQQELNKDEQELKQWKAKQLQKLQEIYDNALAAVGTGHRTANHQIEKNESSKEKQDLRDALAKARGALARERVKAYASQIKPANVPVKRGLSKKENAHIVTKPSQDSDRIKLQKSPSKSNVKPNSPAYKLQSPLKKKGVLGRSKIKGKLPTECTIPSPGAKEKHKHEPRTLQTKPDKSRQRSCSPRKNTENIKEATVYASDDSDDSNVTWPPRSARVTKLSISPPRVKFYNHDQRVCKEYMKPSRSVTHIDASYNDEMEKYIEEEEEAVVKKTELDAAIQKRSVTRGQKALQKELLEKEFKTLAQQLAEVDKQQRIARIFEFPYPIERKEKLTCADNKKVHLDAIPSTSKQPVEHLYLLHGRYLQPYYNQGQEIRHLLSQA